MLVKSGLVAHLRLRRSGDTRQGPARWSRRTVYWLIAGTIVLLVAGSILAYNQVADALASRQAVQRAFQEGADLGGAPAPTFTLRDQTGATVSLTRLRGHPVVLTFFDSVCPHADCSLMAEYLNWTARDLGAARTDVSWVAISVDPWHDTPTSTTAFLSAHQIAMPIHYLLGTPEQLAPVWSAYHMQAILQPDSVVIHSTGVYVLDAQGRERLYLNEGFDPRVLSDYVRVLLKEPAVASVPSRAATSGQPAGAISQTQVVGGEIVALTATPGRFGTYTFTVELMDASGVPTQGAAVDLQLTMTDMQMGSLRVHLAPITPTVPGAYQAQGVLSMKGQWQAVVQVVTPGATQPMQATFQFTTLY
jgi:protein SCO1/2